MAGISPKEIKNRIRSMENTKQITRAMEMVAASKLRKAQTRVLSARPYFETLSETIGNIVNTNGDFNSRYLMARPIRKSVYVVFAGDRGLAGGYNNNVLKQVLLQAGNKEIVILPIGKKAVDFFSARNASILTCAYAQSELVSLGDCFSMAKTLCRQFAEGTVDEVCVAYTNYVSVLTQTPEIKRLLPLVPEKTEKNNQQEIIYEPDSVTVFETIVPEYLGGVLYGALCESRASEQAARRTAMDSATRNADEMIGELSLKFNRARQAAITQEITEIVAGSQ